MTHDGAWTVTVQCDQHRKPHMIERFTRNAASSEWIVWRPPSASESREASGHDGGGFATVEQPDHAFVLTEDGDWLPPEGTIVQRLQGVPALEILDQGDRLISRPHVSQSVGRVRYPNRCERCGANTPLRDQQRLNQVMDAVERGGLTVITLRELAAIARHMNGQ